MRMGSRATTRLQMMGRSNSGKMQAPASTTLRQRQRLLSSWAPNPLFDCSRRGALSSLGSPVAAAAAAEELGSHSPAWGMEHYGSCSPMPRPAPAAVVGLGANSPAVRGMEEHYGSCSPMPRPAPAVAAAAAASSRPATSLSPTEAVSRSAGGSIYPHDAHWHAGVGSTQCSSSKALDFSPCWEPAGSEGEGGRGGGTSGICAAMQLLDSGAYAAFVHTASAASKGQASSGRGEKHGFEAGPITASATTKGDGLEAGLVHAMEPGACRGSGPEA